VEADVTELTAGGAPVAVGCVKWGTRFAPDYVNVLHRAVRAHLEMPFRFVCLTDDSQGLDAEIEAVGIPAFGQPRERWRLHGNWPKVALCAPGIFADDELVLYFDLDVMILGKLDRFVHRALEKPGFHHLQEWNIPVQRLLPRGWRPDRGGQGSILCFRAGEQRHIFTNFVRHGTRIIDTAKGDRSYWHGAAWRPYYFPEAWTASFKHHCVHTWPLNQVMPIRPPAGPAVLVFHGKPRPAELMGSPGTHWGTKRKFGFRPVPWVVEYWRRFGGTLPGLDGPISAE
jgi:hypothetical protein